MGKVVLACSFVDDWRWRMTNDYLQWWWWWLMIVVMIVMQTAVGGLVRKFVHCANFDGQQQAQTPVTGNIWNSLTFPWSKVVFSSLGLVAVAEPPFGVQTKPHLATPMTKSLKRNFCYTDIFHCGVCFGISLNVFGLPCNPRYVASWNSWICCTIDGDV